MLAMGSEKIHPFSWRDIDIDIDFCAIDWGCSQDLAFCLMASCMMVLHLLFLLPNLMLNGLHTRDDLKSYPQVPRNVFLAVAQLVMFKISIKSTTMCCSVWHPPM